MDTYSLVARMPNSPGALHAAAVIVKRYQGNITRISYDRRIDPQTVFFEVKTSPSGYRQLVDELNEIGYLQTTLKSLSFLKIYVFLPHTPGALLEFLKYTTKAGANIAYIDFDDAGQFPDRVTISLDIEQSVVADDLLNQLKSRYKLEILEYDTTGEELDDTVFYVRYAQKLRNIIGNTEEKFLLAFLHDINHIVQELTTRGKDPQEIFSSILQTGLTLKATTGMGFYADIQQVRITGDVMLYCFQLPCGGNIYLFDSDADQVMIDTGYGIYHQDVVTMLMRYGLIEQAKPIRIIITHADADHCGAGGFFDAPGWMHTGTQEIINEANRAYGSRSEDSILEEVYTTMINLFSRFNPPRNVVLLPKKDGEFRFGFPVLHRFSIAGITCEILESLGGHLYGQIFIYSPSHHLLFTADSLMNFQSFSEERKRYNSLADFLVTSVNVDSELARRERSMLMNLISSAEAFADTSLLICGGHGAISILEDGIMKIHGSVERYYPDISRQMNTQRV